MNSIPSDCKYYLYRYIRIDKNEPFYIGVGTKDKKYLGRFNSCLAEYRRAYRKHHENSVLNNFKGELNIEIIYESNDYSQILEKEIEFIKLYGRKNTGTGCLANLTDGGEFNNGRIGAKISEVNKQKSSERMKLNNPNKDGKYLPFDYPGVRERIIERMKTNNPRHLFTGENDIFAKKCYQYDFAGNFIKEWRSQEMAYKSISLTEVISRSSISQCVCGKSGSAGGFQWKAEKFDTITPYKMKIGYRYKKKNNLIIN